MSINLRKQSDASVGTPDAGHLQLFVDASGNLAVKNSGGVVTLFDKRGDLLALDVQTSNPTPIAGQRGFAFAKAVSGIAELFYIDDTGQVTQITDDGALVGAVPAIRSYGEAYLSENITETTLSGAPTFTRVDGTYNAGEATDFSLVNGSGATPGAIRYTGFATRIFRISAAISFWRDASNNYFLFRLAKNGATIAKSAGITTCFGGGEGTLYSSISLSALVSLAQNDYIEVFAARDSGAANITVAEMNLSAVLVG